MKTELEADQRVPCGGFEPLPFPSPGHSLTVPQRDMYRVRVSARFADLTRGEILQLRVLQNEQVVLQLIEFPLGETETLAGERVLDLRADDEIVAEVLHGGLDEFSICASPTDDDSGPGDGTVLEAVQIE